MTTRAFVDGQPAESAALIRFARTGYQHFTTFQVRQGAVRGLFLHLARLIQASRRLFGVTLDEGALRHQLRTALHDTPDASVRISVAARNYTARSMPSPAQLETLILLDPPALPPDQPVHLLAMPHTHPFADLKHAGNFDLFHLRHLALKQGADDAVLLDAHGHLVEGPTFNLFFFHDGQWLWPQAHSLPGTTQQLLQDALRKTGESQQTRPVHWREVSQFDAGFCCHSGGLWPIAAINGLSLSHSPALLQHLQHEWARIPGEHP